jgi:predicted Fe-Mo cluster-binding NifX family protein
MKIAIPATNGVLSSHFTESIAVPTDALKIKKLKDLGVEILICGAISEPLYRELSAQGVRVLGFVAGNLNDVLQAFIAGKLPSPAFSMPGYCSKQNRYRGGAGQNNRNRH